MRTTEAGDRAENNLLCALDVDRTIVNSNVKNAFAGDVNLQLDLFLIIELNMYIFKCIAIVKTV